MIELRTLVVRAILLAVCATIFRPAPLYADTVPQVDEDGTIHVPAFALPESSLLSAESRAELARERIPFLDAFTHAATACPSVPTADPDPEQLTASRRCQA